jgi:hypothetical protein
MAKIKNINDDLGMPITFEASTVEEAVIQMAQAVAACGLDQWQNEIAIGRTVDEIADQLTEGFDYEVVDE